MKLLPLVFFVAASLSCGEVDVSTEIPEAPLSEELSDPCSEQLLVCLGDCLGEFRVCRVDEGLPFDVCLIRLANCVIECEEDFDACSGT